MLDETHLGLLVSTCSLLLGLCSHDPTGYEAIIPKATRLLSMLVIQYYVNPRDPRHHPHIDSRHRPYR